MVCTLSLQHPVPRVLAFLERLLDSKMFQSKLKMYIGAIAVVPSTIGYVSLRALKLVTTVLKGKGARCPYSPRAICGTSSLRWSPIRPDRITMSTTMSGCNISTMPWIDWSQLNICSVLSFISQQTSVFYFGCSLPGSSHQITQAHILILTLVLCWMPFLTSGTTFPAGDWHWECQACATLQWQGLVPWTWTEPRPWRWEHANH